MGSTPSGSCIRASCIRCWTWVRAKYRSTRSSNVTVTTDSAALEIERTRSIPGRPSIAVSIGKVTSCSTSTGESPGASVITSTWLGVKSGKASVLSVAKAWRPATIRTSTAPSTAVRFRKEKPSRRSTRAPMSHHHPGAGALLELGLEGEGSLDDGEIPRRETVQDHHPASVRGAHLDCAGLEASASLSVGNGDENRGMAVDELHRAGGAEHRGLSPLTPDEPRGELSRLEPAAGVLHGRANREGPRGGIKPGAHRIHGRGEGVGREGRHAEAQRAADAKEPQRSFRRAHHQPQARRTGNAAARRARLTHIG